MARRPVARLSRKKLLEQELKRGLDDLKSTRETIKIAQKSLEGFYYKAPPLKRIPDKDYKRMMRLEKTFGLYAPKSTKLTPARKRQIRQHWTQLEHLAKNAVFAEYPKDMSPKTRKTVARDVKRNYPKAPKPSARGIWLPKSERQIISPVGTLRFQKETGLYGVQVTKKTKKGYYAQEFRYIADASILEVKQASLQKFMDRKRQLRKNERLRFIIGGNYSRQIFRNMKDLFAYAANYRRDDQARATFLDQLTIEVVSKGKPRAKWVGTKNNRFMVKDPWTKHIDAFKASSHRQVHPDIIAAMQEEMGEDAEEDD